MTASGPLSPGAAEPPDRADTEPTFVAETAGAEPSVVEMSLAEKLACEWEARHDVMARTGRPGDPAALAHYFSHARSADSLHEHGEHHHTGHPHAHRWVPPDQLRSWIRWGEDTH